MIIDLALLASWRFPFSLDTTALDPLPPKSANDRKRSKALQLPIAKSLRRVGKSNLRANVCPSPATWEFPMEMASGNHATPESF